MRQVQIQEFSFPNGGTDSAETRITEGVAFGGIHASPEAVGKTVQFFDVGPWGEHQVIEKVLNDQWNPFDDVETRSIAPSCRLKAKLAAPAAGETKIWLKLKS